MMFSILCTQMQHSFVMTKRPGMTPAKLILKMMAVFFLRFLLISPLPTMGQFVLPFLYMPLKPLFSNEIGNQPKHLKVTSQHVRTVKGWSLAVTYSQTLENIKLEAIIFLVPSEVTAAILTDLDYYWSYTIPFSAMNGNLSDPDFVRSKKAEYMQEELLKFVSQKFFCDINDVASTLGIPSANLSTSYDPANWEAVVHAMISQSSSAFTRLLELPSVNSLAELVDVQLQDLLNANLSRFEDLVFRFTPKKAVLDVNITSFLINSSGIISGGFYNDVTVAKILQQHENISLSFKEFGILYNLTNEQAKAIGRATFHQIFRICGVSTETILNITLPEVSWKVVGSMHITPPCPVLIAIKGKSIASFHPVFNPQNTVLEILTTVSNLAWRDAQLAVNASLPDWEFLDSVTLIQLATISGNSLETLLNDSVSEAVELVFRMRAEGTLNNATDTHRAFIRRLLEEKFNMMLNEVANLTGKPEVSFLNASSPWLFRSFVAATFTYFRLNLSHIVASVQVSSEEVLYNLPRQEWKSVISAVINSVIKSEAADLQMSDDNLLQFLGVSSVELSISQLKRLIKNQILEVKVKKRKFEDDPVSVYLSLNSVSDADYLNSTVLSLVLVASGYSQEELKLAYGYNSAVEIFILSLMRIKELPLYCSLNTSAIKDRTPYNITTELVGTRGIPAVCRGTRFYISARLKNMSLLQVEFIPFSNSSLSFVRLVELVTGLPWRRNVWAFELKMEDWTVLYVLNEDSFKEVTTGLNLDSYQSRTLLQIFEKSLELHLANNTNIRTKIEENGALTLKILYDVFSTNENELMKLSTKTIVSSPIEVFSLMIDYLLVGKFNVSVSSLETSLDLQPGDLYKLSPTEWPEMIPFVRVEMIRSGRHQLGVSLSNFAKLLEETPESLQSLTFAQIKSKWDSVISKVLKGKRAIETKSVSQIAASIEIASDSLNDVTVLVFTEDRINVTKSELLLLYNFSSIAIDVLSNYTFGELPDLCGVSKEILFNKTTLEIIVSLLGHDNDMSCEKIARVAAASSITVNELARKFSFNVNDSVTLLTIFEDLFNLPWPKIAWAVNASLPDWHILGALSLKNVSTLISQSTQNIRMQKSFREIVTQLLDLSENVYTEDMNKYRSNLVTLAADLFRVNSSKICDDCKIVDIMWNALTQLSQLIDFDPYMLPNELNVSPHEFNLTIPSQWPRIVQPVVRGAYWRSAITLGVDRDRLSILLQTPTAVVENMPLTQYQVLLSQSIQPFIAAKTALSVSPLADLVTAKGMDLSALANESVFDVIDALLNVPMRNISFIFNWTSAQQAKLKAYTFDDIAYYRGVGLRSVGSEKLLMLVEFILQEALPPRITQTVPCKRGLSRESNGTKCTGNAAFITVNEKKNVCQNLIVQNVSKEHNLCVARLQNVLLGRWSICLLGFNLLNSKVLGSIQTGS